jgi:hypothetical protein
MLQKRGQVTLFIIIAIVIVAIALVFVFYIKPQLLSSQQIPSDVLTTKQIITDCLKEKTIEAVQIAGISGGYTSPKHYFDTYLGRISLWYDLSNNSDFRPNLQTIENEAANYIRIGLPLCIISSDNKKMINWTEPKVNVQIFENFTASKVEMPVTIKKGESLYQFKEFEARIPVRLYQIYNTAYNLSKQEIANKATFSPNKINEGDFSLVLINYHNSTIIYLLQDPNSIINNQTYVFMFAGKYA